MENEKERAWHSGLRAGTAILGFAGSIPSLLQSSDETLSQLPISPNVISYTSFYIQQI